MSERIESAEELLIKPKRPGPRTKCTASSEELRWMYLKEGKTAGEIAEKYGMATGSIRKLLKKYGIRKEK